MLIQDEFRSFIQRYEIYYESKCISHFFCGTFVN